MNKSVLLSSLLMLAPVTALAAGNDDTKAGETTTDKPPGDTGEQTIAQKSNAPPEAKPIEKPSITDVKEREGKHYYFIGFRYRGTVVPQFLMNLFVDGGRTVYNSAFGLEFDIHKDNFSIIPSVMLMEHSMEPTLFLEKGKSAGEAGNWTVVGSDVKGLYGAVDLLWGVPFADNHMSFEFGFGVGIGAVIGDISNNWVYGDPNGQLKTTNPGNYSFSPCATTNSDAAVANTAAAGCKAVNHRNSEVDKVGAHYDANGKLVGSYTEKGWTSGGSVPSIFPYLSLPILGLRIKPIKQLELRTQLGFSMTGFYYQLSINYGFEQMK